MLLYATLLPIRDTLTPEAFIELVIEWNKTNTHRENIIPGLEWHGERNIRYHHENLSLTIEEYRNRNIIAVRYEKEAQNGAIWDTDYIMNFDEMQMAIQLDRSYVETAFLTDTQFSTPHFITMLAERGYLKDDGDFPVSNRPVLITAENLGLAKKVIDREDGCRLPVVYVSKTENNENPVNVALLASKLKGIAHVLVAERADLSWELKKICERGPEYRGAIGIYYPNLSLDHKRFLYHHEDGEDEFLQDKVEKNVLRYTNVQNIPELYTWQGVVAALLVDRLTSQQEKRLVEEAARCQAEIQREQAEAKQQQAEARQQQAEAKQQQAEARQQQAEAKQQQAEAKQQQAEEKQQQAEEKQQQAEAEKDSVYDVFGEDLANLRRQLEDLRRANEALRNENLGLRGKLESMDTVPVLFQGKEDEFFPGEIKEIVLNTLRDAVKGGSKNNRREDVIRDIIRSNPVENVCDQRKEKLKTLLTGYAGMTKTIRQELTALGFEITEEGKHYKLKYFGDGRYSITMAKTPSDARGGKNTFSDVRKKLF